MTDTHTKGRRAAVLVGTLIIAAAGMAAPAAPAQVFTTLVNFNGTNGANPLYMSLAQDADGNLYGTTFGGGTYNYGTVFKMSPRGALTTLYSFCAQPNCADGSLPRSGLVMGADGNLYGTTQAGGAGNGGTVFKMTPAGALTTLHSFCTESGCPDGAIPEAALLQGPDGNFYGTAAGGGIYGPGTVFKISPQGVLTTLYTFCAQSGCADGSNPQAALIRSLDGNFYGTTRYGGLTTLCAGDAGCGTVFRVTPAGKLTTLHQFAGMPGDGQDPASALVQAADGNFYGTTEFGGSGTNCPSGCGTVFRVTPGGFLATLHSFDSTDGAFPLIPLVQGSDGNLYGTTGRGGAADDAGTIFRFTLGSTLTTLHQFDVPQKDGFEPLGLVQATNGALYGSAESGGSGGDGTIFRLVVGLGPFVTPVPAAARAGATVTILGTDLTGASSVSFNGTAARFTVVSPTAIRAIVPAGATTGLIQVKLPATTLTSNAPFQVLP